MQKQSVQEFQDPVFVDLRLKLLKEQKTLSAETEDGTIHPYVIAREYIFGI